MTSKLLLIYSLVITGLCFNQYLTKEKYLVGVKVYEELFLNTAKINTEQNKLIQDLYKSKSKFKSDYLKCDQQLYLTEKKVRFTMSKQYKHYLTGLIASTLKN